LKSQTTLDCSSTSALGIACALARNLAMTKIIKTTTTLLKTFELEAVERETPLRLLSYGVGEMEGPLLCKAKLRDANVGA
jgi:hypothetical protein